MAKGLNNILYKRPSRNKIKRGKKMGKTGSRKAVVVTSGRNMSDKGKSGNFIFDRVGAEVWADEDNSDSNPRVAKLTVSEKALDVFGSTIIITISDISNGWS